MTDERTPAEPRSHEAAIRIARECLYVIRGCLREEECGDALREFYRIARDGMAEFEASHTVRKDADGGA